MTKNTTNVKKMSRHEPAAKIKPVKVGPIAGANMITKARTPLTVPNLFGGKINIAIVNIKGKMIPVPIPWIILPIKTIGKLTPNPEISEPTIKAPRPNKTNFLVANHLVSKLESGRTIPITSI